MIRESKTGIKIFLVHSQMVEGIGSYPIIWSWQMHVIGTWESILIIKFEDIDFGHYTNLNHRASQDSSWITRMLHLMIYLGGKDPHIPQVL